MNRRVLVLPFAAALIAALSAWKISQPPQRQSIPENAEFARVPAPDFELPDQGRDLGDRKTLPSRRVRLKSYLGRHRVLLVFFDGEHGADVDPLLLALRDRHADVEKNRLIVLGIATALPQQNRQATARAGDVPFPLLSDLDGTVCKTWGMLDLRDDGAFRNRPGVFAIDRAGNVAWKNGLPVPERTPLDRLDSLISGE